MLHCATLAGLQMPLGSGARAEAQCLSVGHSARLCGGEQGRQSPAHHPACNRFLAACLLTHFLLLCIRSPLMIKRFMALRSTRRARKARTLTFDCPQPVSSLTSLTE